jgi:hypothetical protein
MELLVESKRVPMTKLADLMREAEELISIFVASINTSRKRG